MTKHFLTLILTVIAMANVNNPANAANNTATATFAGGCFWCMESEFDSQEGVIDVVSGYTGGAENNPNYKDVSKGRTGHYEAVQVTYNPAKVNYNTLLEIFWSNIDPFDAEGQFCDKGDQYRAAIFYSNSDEKQKAEASSDALAKFHDEKIVTAIIPASIFWAAEEYHQDYHEKNSWGYKLYRNSCGRDKRLEQVWGDADIKGLLPAEE